MCITLFGGMLLRSKLNPDSRLKKWMGFAGRNKMTPEASNVYRIDDGEYTTPAGVARVLAMNCFYKHPIPLGLQARGFDLHCTKTGSAGILPASVGPSGCPGSQFTYCTV